MAIEPGDVVWDHAGEAKNISRASVAVCLPGPYDTYVLPPEESAAWFLPHELKSRYGARVSRYRL